MSSLRLNASEFSKIFWLEAQRLPVESQSRYHLYSVYHYHHKLNLHKLKLSLQKVVDDHYHLRSNFVYENDVLQHVIQENVIANILIHKASTKESAEYFLQEAIYKPFDLSKDQLYRFVIIENQFENSISLLVNFHHIILDGTQYDNIINQIEINYKNQQDIKKNTAADIALLKKYLESENAQILQVNAQSKINRLSQYPLNIDLPYSQNPINNIKIYHKPIVNNQYIIGDDYQKLKEFSREMNFSIFNIMKVAFVALISKYANQEELIITYPINMRGNQFQCVHGCFVNTLYSEFSINEKSFLDILNENQAEIIESKKNSDHYISPIMIRNDLDISKLNVSISMISTRYQAPDLADIVKKNDVVYPLAGADIAFYFDDNDRDVFLQFVFPENAINESIVEKIGVHFNNCLNWLIKNYKNRPLSQVNIMSRDEYKKIIYAQKSNKREYSKNKTIHQLFEEQVAKTPENIATIFEDQTLTYQQLNEKANQLANYIRKEYFRLKSVPMPTNTIIPLFLERSLDMAVAILAVMKSGGAYLPMDIDFPQDRIDYILADANSILLLTQSKFSKKISLKNTVHAIKLDEVPYHEEEKITLNQCSASSDLAYIIYTSGTTGGPKGVMLNHEGVVNRIEWMQNEYGLNENDKILQKTPYTFDVSVWELLWANWYGGSIVFAKPEGHKDNQYIDDLIRRESVTKLHFVPSMLTTYLEYLKYTKLSIPESIKHIFCSGEALTPNQVRSFNSIKSSQSQLHNLYGPTEASIDVTSFDCTQMVNKVPIGKPIQNVNLYILDKNLKPVPVGITGELYIGGVCVAKGYLNKPELTREKFILNPFVKSTDKKNSVLYKTGDLTRWISDGNIEYLGRNDFQVKINGLRIELGEIENELSSFPGVKESFVIIHEKNNKLDDVNKYIVAYYLSDHPFNEEELRLHLGGRLPEHMVPNFFIHIDKIPLTANGKLNRKALPAPNLDERNENYVKPETDFEVTLCEIWQNVLDCSKVGVHDNFFKIGGNSILCIRIISMLNKLGYQLSVRDFFEHKTVKNIAKVICNKETEEEKYIKFSLLEDDFFDDKKVDLNLLEDAYPVSNLQFGMLLTAEMKDNGTYHDVFAYKILNEFIENDFLSSWQFLISKHPLLRTSFVKDNKHVYVALQMKEISDGIMQDKILIQNDISIKSFIDEEKLRKFDYENPGLFKIIVSKQKGKKSEFILIFSFHHAIADGWSISSLISEFINVYVNKSWNQTIVNLPAYPCFVAKEKKAISDESLKAFWKKYLADYEPDNGNFLLDFETNTQDFLQVNTYLSDLKSNKIIAYANKIDVSVDVIFFTAYQLLLATFYNKNDITIGWVLNNRLEEEGGDKMFGVFLNTLPVRMNVKFDEISELVKSNYNEKVRLYQYKSYPYGNIKSDLKIQQDVYQCAFNYIQFSMSELNTNKGIMQHASGFSYASGFERTNIPLLFNVMREGERFGVQINGDGRFIDQATISKFLKYIINYINQIISESDCFHKITNKEYIKVVYSNNETKQTFTINKTLHELFQEQAKKTPDEIAVVFNSQSLSYKVLNEKSNQLARHISKTYFDIYKKEISADVIIPVCIERSIDMIIGIMAILKSGAAYVPIDVSFSDERIKYIFKDVQSEIALFSKKSVKKNLAKNIQCILIDEYQQYSDQLVEDLLSTSKHNNLAYVIYTSGTTGDPKGVLVEHSSVINTIFSLNDVYNFNKQYKRTSCFTAYTFDVSISEIFSALLNGAELHIFDEDCRKSPEVLAQYINNNQLHYVYLPPAVLSVLPRIEYPSLQTIIFAGEPCDQQVGEYWAARYKLYNYYGPTEVSIYATGKQAEARNINEIGKPINNVQAYVLDQDLYPVPIGVVGELYIGGAGVARGYLNKPELTKQRFIKNRFLKSGKHKLYKTGDLVRWRCDGNLEYIGRNDFQIKIRGFRIELGEIENALSKIKEIKRFVLRVREINGSKELICFYTADNLIVDYKKFREILKENLADYMVPSYWKQVDEFPLTLSGKTDYSKLESLLGHVENLRSAPLNNFHHDILSIWKEVLFNNDIGLDDNFFDVGGHSLRLMQVKFKLEEKLNIKNVSIVDLFKFPTVRTLCEYLSNGNINRKKQSIESEILNLENKDIAIIGYSGAFSGADSTQEFWENIISGKESIEFLSKEECQQNGVEISVCHHEEYIPAAGHVSNIDSFDPEFWNISPKDAALLDPQIRKFIEHCWASLESAGYAKNRQEHNIGLFCGASQSAYMTNHIINNTNLSDKINIWEANSMQASSYLATRASYLLGLTGPAININTACSTSLVAIVEACEKLAAGKCNMALAGASSLLLKEQHGYIYQEGMIFSKDGHCRPFDINATGTINGSGVGVILLKRLDDAIHDGDKIYATIKGYASNNDGYRKVGYTAPSVIGQTECIMLAHKQAGITSDMISYVECHGTGTKMGDPIEVAALHEAFTRNLPKDKKIECILGSVKANIGHVDSASGIAGVIKVCQMLEHKIIPPQINFDSLNPSLDINDGEFKIVTEKQGWEDNNNLRKAGISSFGVGGTNAHIILEEYLMPICEEKTAPSDVYHILPISAKNSSSLSRYKDALLNYLKNVQETNLHDIAYTLQQKREHFNLRQYFICKSIPDAIKKIEESNFYSHLPKTANSPELIFMFSGQGAQYVGMGTMLYNQNGVFKENLDKCFDIINRTIKKNIREYIFNDDLKSNILQQTQLLQPALFSISYAMAKQLESWNVHPTAYIGHSIGEYVAATLAGVFSLEDGLKVVIQRGKLMQEMPMGSMLAIHGTVKDISEYLPENLEISVVNSPQSCVVSGEVEEINKFKYFLDERKITSKKLYTSHAFHSKMMNKAADEFEKFMKTIELKQPQKPFISGTTGKTILGTEVTSAHYWASHIRKPILFSDGVEHLIAQDGHKIFLEVGPGDSLSSFVKQHSILSGKHLNTISTMLSAKKHEMIQKERGVDQKIYHAIGELWSCGYPIDWNVIDPRVGKTSSDLPTYQFEKQNCWVNKPKNLINKNLLDIQPESNWYYQPVWNKLSNIVSANQINLKNRETWLIFNDSINRLNDFTEFLKNNGQNVISVYFDKEIYKLSINKRVLKINPFIEDNYQELFEFIQENSLKPSFIIHAGTVTSLNCKRDLKEIEQSQFFGFYSLFLIQKYLLSNFNHNIYLSVLTNGLTQITGRDVIHQEKGTLLGAVRVIPHEMPWVKTCCLDIDFEQSCSTEYLINFIQSRVYYDNELTYALKFKTLWRQNIEKIQQLPMNRTIIRDNDVVMITGGLGGIGLSIAKEISKNHKVNFILVSRETRKISDSKKQIINYIEKNGSNVIIESADLTKYSEIEDLIKKIKIVHGSITGIIHAAGAPPLGMKNKSIEDLRSVISAKAFGAQYMLEALSAEEISYFVMTSSITSLMGTIGTIEYAAANSYLDVLCSSHINNIKQFLAINWPKWTDVGMGTNINSPILNENQKIIELNSLSSRQGGEIFYQLINQSEQNQVAISKFDIVTLKNKIFEVEESPFKLNNEINNENIKLLIENDATDLEKKISEVFYEILGVERFSKHGSFFELGGSSLNAVMLVNKLKNIGMSVSISDILTHNSVSLLSGLSLSASNREKIIVPLKINKNSDNKIFIVHPVGGTLMMYLDLVKKLDDSYSYYGIQNVDFENKLLVEEDTLEKLAAVYIAEIKKIQKNGVYTLMGASLGGTLAYEMARQLVKSGEKVDSVMMFDSWAIFSDANRDKDNFKSYMLDQMKVELDDLSKDLNSIISSSKNDVENIVNARWGLMKLLLNYSIPEHDLAIDLHLFKANTLDKYHVCNGAIYDNGWQKYINKTICVYNIEGDHITLLSHPGVDQISLKINQLLNVKKANIAELAS